MVELLLNGNQLEAGAIARLSGAEWPAWKIVRVDFLDGDECERLGVQNFYEKRLKPGSNRPLHLGPSSAVLPGVVFAILF